ncbi:MAG: DUF3368 domain-containing protein [Exilibacterium sp.]
MTKVIVADTGPLIALALVKLLPTLSNLFAEVLVPPSVVIEATEDISKPGAQAIKLALDSGLIKVHPVEVTDKFEELVELLDRGEAEALALAKQLNAVALIDERQGRKAATKQGITVTGSAAILIKAKSAGVIDEVKPLFEILRGHGYRMSERLIVDVLQRCGE